MIKYQALFRKPVSYGYSEYGEPHPTMSVIEDIAAPEPTGLVDVNGTLIYRIVEKAPVGFCNI